VSAEEIAQRITDLDWLRIEAYATVSGQIRIRDLRRDGPIADLVKPGRWTTLSPERAARLYGLRDPAEAEGVPRP